MSETSSESRDDGGRRFDQAGVFRPAIGARTEHLRISTARACGPMARVHWIEHLGDQNHVHIDLAGHPLVTLADPNQPLKVGDHVSLELADPLYFDKSGNRIDVAGL